MFYNEREEENLDYDPDQHHYGSRPSGSLSYVYAETGEFIKGPDSDAEDDFDAEQTYEMYAEDCVGPQNLENTGNLGEDDSFFLNGLFLASQHSRHSSDPPETEYNKVAESDGNEFDAVQSYDCVGTGSICDPQYLYDIRRLSEEDDDDDFGHNGDSQHSTDSVETDDAESGGYICHICGIKPKNMRIHYNARHKGPCPCGFCGKVMEFSCIAAHIRLEHRAETGLFDPPPKADDAQPLDQVDLEAELDKIRGNRNWRIINKSGYCCLYDENMHTPIAVMQRLTKASLVYNVGGKAASEMKFYAAQELEVNVDHKSFTREGKDVGHLAARADCVASESAYKDSHSMLNGVPQDPRVNGGVIRVSEHHGRKLVEYWDDLFILTGPIYDEDAELVESINGVVYPIPTAFFKIFIMRREGEPSRIMTFIISNKFENSNLYNRKATLQQISERTGLDLSAYEHLQCTWDLEEPMFKCPQFRCFHTYTTESELKEHLRGHIWKCYKCCEELQSESEKTEHLDTHRIHICEFCEKGFMEKGDLFIHERIHTGETPYVCREPECGGASFKQKSQFTRHQKLIHEEDKPYDCKMDGCGMRFKLKQYLAEHTRTHTDERPFVCSDCGLAFRQLSTLNGHIKEVHKKKRPHQCDQCKQSFSRKSGLKRHIKSVHLMVKDYICETGGCGRSFSRMDQLKNHQFLHNHLPNTESGQDPSDAATCSKGGSTVSGKRKIDEVSSTPPVSVSKQLCVTNEKAVFNPVFTPATSKRDGSTVAGNKDNSGAAKSTKLPFVCKKKECGLGFPTKDAIIEHINKVHSKDYPYRCKEPGCELLSFALSCYLDKHNKTVHLKVRDKICQVCGKGFSSLGNLKRHELTHQVVSGHNNSDSATSTNITSESAPPKKGRGKSESVPPKKGCGKSESVPPKKGRITPSSTVVKPEPAPQRNAHITPTDTAVEVEIITLD